MANVTKSVIAAGGGDYTTIQAALNAADVSTGYYKVEIQDNSEYIEALSINSVVGTPSITNYVWLAAAPANRHAGVAGTSYARIKNTAAANCLEIDVNYTRVEHLEILQTSTTTDKHGIAIFPSTTITDVVISRMIIRSTSTATHQFGIITTRGASVHIDHCNVYGWSGFGIGDYFYSSGSTLMTTDVDYCTVWGCGTANVAVAGSLRMQDTTAANQMTMNAYNTIGCGTVNKTDWSDGTNGARTAPNGTVIWNGSNNLRTTALTDLNATDNITAWQDASAGGATTVTTTASAYIATNLTSGSEDLTPVYATGAGSNLALGNGVNRIGSEPDPRQDFSIDITGVARQTTNIDIGAFQVSNKTVNVPVFALAPSSAGLKGFLTFIGALAGSTSGTSDAKSVLVLSGPITGSAPSASGVRGDLTGSVPVAGSVASSSGVRGDLTGSVPVAGSVASSGAARGILSLAGQKAISGSAASVSEAKGSLAGTFTISGSVAAATGLRGQTIGDVPVSGSMSSTAGTKASLSGSVPVTASIPSAAELKGDLVNSKFVSGSAASSSGAAGDLTSVGFVTGSAPSATNIKASMTIAVIASGSPSTSSGLKASLSGSVPVTGSASSASGAKGSMTTIVFVFGSLGSVAEISGAATVGIPPDSGSSSSASGLSGSLLGGRTPFLTRWQLASPSTGETYVFTTNPTSGGVPTSSKQIVYSNTVATDGKTLIYERPSESQEVNLTGTVLTRTELEALELWASKRSALILTDDLLRTYTIYISSFVANRVRKASHPYYHKYTLSYIII